MATHRVTAPSIPYGEGAMRRMAIIAWALVACGAPAAGPGEPPAGRSQAEYLADPERPAPERPADTDSAAAMRIHFIDIGQGAAHLLEFPCGAVLIDTGGEHNEQFDSEAVLLAYLDAFFEGRPDLERTLDTLFITHPHIDHTRSIQAVLERYQVRNLVDNGIVADDLGGEPVQWMHQWRQGREVGYRYVLVGEVPDTGLGGDVIDAVGPCAASAVDPRILALWGGTLGTVEQGHKVNDDSVALRVDFGAASALFPGDLEKLGIARMTAKYEDHPELLEADVYQVSHHGSKNSTAQHLIARVRPRVAVMSHGPYERYLRTEEEYTARQFGHPHKDSITQLVHPDKGVTWKRPEPIEAMIGLRGGYGPRSSEFEKATIEAAIYATGWEGTVVITAYENGWLEVTTER